MSRSQKRQNAPQGLPVDESPAAANARCSCRAHATVRYRNSWREADSCGQPECRLEAISWVANRHYSRRKTVARPVMAPPQQGKIHPLTTRDAGPRAKPPGPRALGASRP